MMTIETIQHLRNNMFQAARAYRQAIVQNLQEIGEEVPVRSEYQDEDDPQGCRVTSINQNNDEAFQAVVCGIRFEQTEPVTPILIHVTEWDGEKCDQWYGLSDLDESAADYVLSSIQWPENI